MEATCLKMDREEVRRRKIAAQEDSLSTLVSYLTPHPYCHWKMGIAKRESKIN